MTEKNIRSKTSKRTQLFMERAWLVIGTVSFLTWIYSLIREGASNGTMLLVITGISFLMYFLRRYLRKQNQGEEKEGTKA